MRDALKMAGFVLVMMIVASLIRTVAMNVAVGAVEADESWNAWRETLPVDPNLVIYAGGALALVVIGLVAWQISRRQKQQLEEAMAKARKEAKEQSQDLIRFD